MKAAVLFSGAGICEHYLKDIGINVVVANELVKSRAVAHTQMYPDCKMINADITLPQTQREIISQCKENRVDLIIATPPCQGVSSAGSNKTEDSILDDPRNYLVMSALNIIDEVLPMYFLIENVPRFQQMLFPFQNEQVTLEQLLIKKYSCEYEIKCDVFDAANYGVPQTRYRVVYRAWKKDKKWEEPQQKPIITVREAIGDLPSLEPGEDSLIKNHHAKSSPINHIECMRYTPTGKSAFANEEHYPKKKDGTRIKGYGNSYKRISWDKPAPTITMRNEIVSSQENVHPGRQNPDGTWSDARVLTLRELLILSSLPAELDCPANLSETAFRQLIGEGIPPLLMKEIMKGIKENYEED